MSWRAEIPSAAENPSRARLPRLAALALTLCVLLFAGILHAQTSGLSEEMRRDFERWDAIASEAEALVDNNNMSVGRLEEMRSTLVDIRAEATQLADDNRSVVSDLNERLEALGEPPPDSVSEPPDVAEVRSELETEIRLANAPVQRADEIIQRINYLLRLYDRSMFRRLSDEATRHYPMPVRPVNWGIAWTDLKESFERQLAVARMIPLENSVRDHIITRLPVNILFIAVGLTLAIYIRRRLAAWAEYRIVTASHKRSVALAVALRNLVALLIPTIGAGMVFGVLRYENLVDETGSAFVFYLPSFVLVIIAAGWLRTSLFAPRASRHRPLPLDDATAVSGGNTVLALGFLVALNIIHRDTSAAWNLSPTAQSVLLFPVTVLAALMLWRAAGTIRAIRDSLLVLIEASSVDMNAASMGVYIIRMVERIVRFVAVAAPFIAAAGYMNLARFSTFPVAKTLGLIAAAAVVFDVFTTLARSWLTEKRIESQTPASGTDDGLIPVIIGAVIMVGSIPLFLMIWGVNWPEIVELIQLMGQGVTLGNMRISFAGVVKFLFVAGLILGIFRVLQSLVRGVVLPRTKLDAGVRNAVTAGLGYVGVAIALLAGVSAAGFDLSGLAIVAGALSVGIGFGLQNIVSNFVSGIILLIERPIKEGDWIEVAGFSGYVKGTRVRSTEIETFERGSVIVPNSDLIAGTVLNRTHTNTFGRLAVPVGVSYDSDPRQVEKILIDIIEQNPLVLENPAPTVLFMEFGPSSLNFEIRCYLRDVNYMMTVLSDTNFEIFERFAKEGITIPFPQQTLHLHEPEKLAKAFGRGETIRPEPAPQEE